MATAMKRTNGSGQSSGADRKFPPEAYAFDDDVTPAAVESLRQRAAKTIDAEEWETVDGFGRVFHADVA